MANPDETTEEPKDKEPGVAGQIARITRAATLQRWLAIIMLPVMTLGFMAGLISLAELHKNTQAMLVEKPASLVQQFYSKIAAAQTAAEEQYQQYHQQMEDDSITRVSQHLQAIYQHSMAAEEDYLTFLARYQQLSYAVSSRVKGSGEWHYYFEQSLQGITATASQRQAAMAKIVAE